MSDPYNVLGRFELEQSDGIHCYQVLAYNAADVQYWTEQAHTNGYLIAFDRSMSQGVLLGNDVPFDTYQIFPPEQADKFSHLKIIE